MEYRANVRYHTQDSAEYCGAAVAMMLFEHLNIKGTQQVDLFARGSQLTINPEQFFIDPAGLQGLLNEYLEKHGHPVRYQVFECESGREAVRVLASSLKRATPLPGFALPNAHWVLIDGFEEVDGPAGPGDRRPLGPESGARR